MFVVPTCASRGTVQQRAWHAAGRPLKLNVGHYRDRAQFLPAMISLLILDHPSWWTVTGMFFKYFVIAIAVRGCIAICVRSFGIYFLAGWAIVIALPLFMLSLAEKPLGLFAQQPRQEQIFIYVWIFVALVELFLIWVPAVSFAIRQSRKTANDANPTHESAGALDADKQRPTHPSTRTPRDGGRKHS